MLDCASEYARWLVQPDIIEHYEQVLPRLFQALDDPTADVQEKSVYALARLKRPTLCPSWDGTARPVGVGVATGHRECSSA